jgi:hypothetical protein
MVEQHLGGKKYLAFYLTCGIFGGLVYLVLNAAGNILIARGLPPIPGLLFNDIRTPLVGASAGVFGIIMACAYIAPNTMMQLLFPPVSLRLKTLAYVYVGLAIASLLFGAKNAGGEAAHIGGAAAGAYFIRNSHLLRDFFDVFTDSRKHKPRAPRKRLWGRAPEAPAGPTRASEDEVDRILSKVATRGIHSLSEAEKTTLRRATESRRDAG